MEFDQDDYLCNEKIFKSIFLQNYKLVRNYLNNRFKNYEISEECAQNAFIILWENCGKIKPIQAKKFLFTTSNRLVLNHYRREKVKIRFQKLYREDEIDYLTPDLIFDENELNKKIYTAIRQLPEKQKVVFMMNRFENQTYRQISVLLDISVKSVEKRMHRALLGLKELLK